MGPDSGMALGIGIVMLLMIAGVLMAFVLLGRAVARACDASPGQIRMIGLLTAVAGVAAGVLAVGWTFYWSD